MMERKYSKKHLWMCIDGNKAKIGITDYAHNKLGNILFLNLPDCDEEIDKGQAFGDIESVKTVSDLIAPVSGKVLAINEELIDEPEQINEEPYLAWLIEIEVEENEENLMDENQYEEYIKEL